MGLCYVFISVAFGAVGYLIATFYFQPILSYKHIKSQIISDLIYYTNIIGVGPEDTANNEILKEKVLEMIATNRRHAADLAAIVRYLPKTYLCYLYVIKEKPRKAVTELIRLSNTSNYDEGMTIMTEISQHLRIDLYEKL